MDTIYFDYGLYKVQLINETNLSESFIKRGELGELYNKQNIHFKDTFQTENEFYYWSELNKRTVQTILPKVSGKGVIGFYFDSVRLYYNQNLKLTIYGRDLKPENEERLKKVISTIEFCSE